MTLYKDNQPVTFQFIVSAQKGKENKSILLVIDDVSRERARIRAEERADELFPSSAGWEVVIS